MITKVLDRLLLSDYADAVEESLVANGVKTVLSVSHECIPKYRVDVRHVILPLEDGKGIPKEYYDIAIKLIRDRIKVGKVLVHCCSGVSRSPVIVLAYLMSCGFSYDEAFSFLSSKKPIINPHPELIRSLATYFSQRSPNSEAI